jgi:S1-C subfamily serine protease
LCRNLPLKWLLLNQALVSGLWRRRRNEFGGMVLGDVIVGLQGKPVKLQKDLFAILDECRPGDKVKVDVLRKGKKETIEVVVGARDLVPVGE